MGRYFVYCETCSDTVEAESSKGKYYCENCGTEVTKQVEYSIKKELTKNTKTNKNERY